MLYARLLIGLLALAGLALACGGGGPGPPTPESTEGAAIEGTIAYVFADRVYTVDVASRQTQPLAINTGTPDSLSWSPDGQSVALCGDGGLWILQGDGGGARNLMPDYCSDVTWSPQGDQIAFIDGGAGGSDLFVISPDGTNRVNLTRALTEALDYSPYLDSPAWSPDGQRLVFRASAGFLYIAMSDGAEPPTLLVQVPGGLATNPRFSPDGKAIAYIAYAPDEPALFIIMLDDGTPRKLAPATGFYGNIAWIDSEDIAYIARAPEGDEVRAIGRDGSHDRRLAGPYRSVWRLETSPDGKSLAFLVAEESRDEESGSNEVFVAATGGSGSYQVTFDGAWKTALAWAPSAVPAAGQGAPIDFKLTRPPIPSRPVAFAQYPDVIARYLTENHGTSDCLAGLLKSWGLPARVAALSPVKGSLCLHADTTGDGRDEVIVAVQDALDEGDLTPGDLLIFTPVGERYELAYSARDWGVGRNPYIDNLVNVTVLQVRDINDDRRAEVLFQSFSPGADNPGGSSVFVIGWNGNRYRLLTPDLTIRAPTSIGFGTYRQSPSLQLSGEGDGGGVFSGPQRALTYIYVWNGTNFELATTYGEPSRILYFNILDANEAFAEGNYWLAVGRYLQSIADEGLLDLQPLMPEQAPAIAGRPELISFAYFRLGLSYLRLGNKESGIEAFEKAVTAYPESLHSQAAQRFLDLYRSSGDEEQSCKAMTEFAAANLESFEAIWDYRYGSGKPSFKPEALCLEPGLSPVYNGLSWRPGPPPTVSASEAPPDFVAVVNRAISLLTPDFQSYVSDIPHAVVLDKAFESRFGCTKPDCPAAYADIFGSTIHIGDDLFGQAETYDWGLVSLAGILVHEATHVRECLELGRCGLSSSVEGEIHAIDKQLESLAAIHAPQWLIDYNTSERDWIASHPQEFLCKRFKLSLFATLPQDCPSPTPPTRQRPVD